LSVATVSEERYLEERAEGCRGYLFWAVVRHR
jgi:hypothetical protein